jgi:ABC-type nitrate/sulfonate/bicarbonate transport system substrate-binding protein
VVNNKLIFLAGGLSPVALMAGEVPFALMSAGVMLPAALRGADLVMVAALSNYLNQVLAMTPELADPKQLKGKRIAIQRLGDLTHVAAREALKHVGLAESDLQFQQIGGGPARFTALQSGLVQAAVLTPPYSTRARKLARIIRARPRSSCNPSGAKAMRLCLEDASVVKC